MKDRVILITGASRGIGATMAKLFAQKGAKVGVLGKTQEPHPKLEGTIHSVVEEITRAGGEALALPCDVRDELAVNEAITLLVKRFGGVDVLINNASAIQLTSIQDIEMKRFDLMMEVNMRGTFLCSKLCLPYLMQGKNPHILTMSPPLNMNGKWFKQHLAYTMSKYGMSMNTLGLSAALKGKVSVNSLWPRTIIATAAIANNFSPEMLKSARTPAIVADAAYEILTQQPSKTGQFFLDEVVLRESGIKDFSHYACDPKANLIPDLFLD